MLKTGHAAGIKIERLIIGRDRQHLVIGIAVVRFGGRVGDAIRKMTADKHGAARNGAPALVCALRVGKSDNVNGDWAPKRDLGNRAWCKSRIRGADGRKALQPNTARTLPLW